MWAGRYEGDGYCQPIRSDVGHSTTEDLLKKRSPRIQVETLRFAPNFPSLAEGRIESWWELPLAGSPIQERTHDNVC